ncbi:peptide/nickel transport system ATP-binding protein [Marinactinospora thermotolerans DSM 45154]|uniref:Peptide/nickel transport system ATP-binding protein n=1 Tax=Marinactinospora thermotolerans DSM 45154 TaxID=1122192 RepID=A0A1T4RPH2_9ACTN|nr:ABC transporter ATP-binding protein [Marinactinospora thermotolerans]SKA17890.1 peptide/nickel transport system ATP-binding protein [Marinactinospora thermotolerans DSM 45154]
MTASQTRTETSVTDQRPGDAPVLEVTDLHVTFPGVGKAPDVRAVRGVSYALRRGEVLGIVGESGSGKSVSSLAAMGLLPDYAQIRGSVRLHGEELLGLDDREMAKRRGKSIAMVFQDPLSGLTPVYTVGDQIAEAVRIHNPDVGKEQAAARAVELLELVGIPNAAQRAKAFPHEFSGGMRQRAMIAIAIANQPDVIICDEPTTALDVTIQAQILDVLKTAQRETGAAIVMITHDLGVVAGFVDRVLVMYAGRPVEIGDVDDVYYRTRMPYTMGLLGSVPRLDDAGRAPLVPIKGTPPSLSDLPPGCPFAPRCPIAEPRCTAAEPELVRIGASGHRAACVRAEEVEENGWGAADIYPLPDIPDDTAAEVPRQERDVVLEVEDLVKHHPLMKGAVFKRRVGTVYAVDGISFDVRERETLGLVGESGCGKSTTLMEILSLDRPQRGRVVVLGRESGTLNSRQRFETRRELQVVFQDPMSSLDPRMPVFDIVAEPLRTHGHPKARLAARVNELLRLVGLDPAHAARYPQEFSGGQRQRIGIARALALEPRLLVLDEPVSALDVSIQAGVINLLDELKVKLGLSYLFVAHDLSVIRHIADRVAVMYLGRIVELGDVESIYRAPAHPYTQALLSAIPIPDPEKERARTHIVLEGDLPSPADPPSGCSFRTRCPKFKELGDGERRLCLDEEPQIRPLSTGDHGAACHYAQQRAVV